MKLKYTKPAFVIERFNLTQSIASGCTAEDPANPSGSVGDPNRWDKNTCGWDVGGYTLWIGEASGCDVPMSPNENYMGICYNNPDGGNVIFGS